MQKLILVVFLAASSLASHANDAAQGLFLKTRCEGKLSPVVLSSLKDAINASQKFRLVSSLDDDGHLTPCKPFT